MGKLYDPVCILEMLTKQYSVGMSCKSVKIKAKNKGQGDGETGEWD